MPYIYILDRDSYSSQKVYSTSIEMNGLFAVLLFALVAVAYTRGCNVTLQSEATGRAYCPETSSHLNLLDKKRILRTMVYMKDEISGRTCTGVYKGPKLVFTLKECAPTILGLSLTNPIHGNLGVATLRKNSYFSIITIEKETGTPDMLRIYPLFFGNKVVNNQMESLALGWTKNKNPIVIAVEITGSRGDFIQASFKNAVVKPISKRNKRNLADYEDRTGDILLCDLKIIGFLVRLNREDMTAEYLNTFDFSITHPY